jgi:hypothetical protein
MKMLWGRYYACCQEADFLRSMMLGFLFLTLSFIAAHYAGLYATEMAGHPVHDLILDYLPTRDVTFLHINAALAFWFIFSGYMILNPAYLPFITKTAALFIAVRSVFICLTHLGQPPNQLFIPDNYSALILFDGDLFFSGHVGGPFLMMLVFWDQMVLRTICFVATLFFAYIVLVGHIHYSIDVLAAPFITYSIYHLSRLLFSRDYLFFNQTLRQRDTSY